MRTIADNIKSVNERIAEAAIKSGRMPSDITLVAVTKTVGIPEVKEAMAAGLTHFAENRVQLLLEKQADPELAYPDVDWHLIGHLQTNKVKYIIDRVSLIHSVDSLRLAAEIDRHAARAGKNMPVLLELNISGEESKYGLAPAELDSFLEGFSELKNVTLKGLMTMAPLVVDDSEKHKIFYNLHKLYVDISNMNLYNTSMSIMSMGMSSDFEVAISEGSNMVRIGTDIFYRG